MTASLDTRYQLIYTEEKEFTRQLALKMVKRPVISSWVVIAPLLFGYHAVQIKKYQAQLRTFMHGFLFTKKLALSLACKMAKEGLPKSLEKIAGLLESEGSDFPEEVRRKQEKEISLLVDHYARLLRAPGEDYAALLQNAYPAPADYEKFLEELQQAEKEVNQEAVAHLKNPEAARSIASRMEEAVEELRLEKAKEVFQTHFQPEKTSEEKEKEREKLQEEIKKLQARIEDPFTTSSSKFRYLLELEKAQSRLKKLG